MARSPSLCRSRCPKKLRLSTKVRTTAASRSSSSSSSPIARRITRSQKAQASSTKNLRMIEKAPAKRGEGERLGNSSALNGGTAQPDAGVANPASSSHQYWFRRLTSSPSASHLPPPRLPLPPPPPPLPPPLTPLPSLSSPSPPPHLPESSGTDDSPFSGFTMEDTPPIRSSAIINNDEFGSASLFSRENPSPFAPTSAPNSGRVPRNLFDRFITSAAAKANAKQERHVNDGSGMCRCALNRRIQARAIFLSNHFQI